MAFHASAVRPGSAGLVFALMGVCACGGSPSPPDTGQPGPGGGGTITGRERIGWAQQADSRSHLETFDFAIYVDGSRSVLNGDACTDAPAGGFECSAPLPPLTPGQHTIELASFITTDGAVVESDRSSPLRVTVAGSTTPADTAPPEDSTIVSSEGHRFRASIVARGLDDPTDLAIAPDGRVFVAERAGRVRILDTARDAGLADPPALELDGVAVSAEAGLTAIALHPGFDRNGHVYLAYAVDGRLGAAFRIARFRERDGILAQGAVVAREREPSGHAVLRFGPDGRLYVGVAAGDDPRESQRAASVLGKILRLNDDGTTPRDNPGASPVFSSGHRDPRALAWHPSTRALWELERDRDAGDELNAIVSGGHYGWPVATGGTSDAQGVAASLVLAAGTDVSSASFVPLGSASPLAGELLVASRGADDLLRIRVGSEGHQPGLVEGMLQGRYGRIGAVGVSGDGTIYFATGNRDTWGAGRDLLVQLSAEHHRLGLSPGR